MADTLLFPNISFDESDVGPTPPQAVTGNRIGVVGEFLRGPYGTFTTLSTGDDLMRQMGKTTHNGSVAIQTAQDQGARDFGTVRVMGAPVQAGAFVKFALTSPATSISASGQALLMLSGVVAPVVGNGVSTREALAGLLVQAINASTMPLQARQTGNVLTISSSNTNCQSLPLMFRLVDPTNLLGNLANTGVLLKDSLGNVLPADTVFRLVGGSTQITVDYDPSAVAANLTLSDTVALVNGDSVTAVIDSASQTVVAALAPVTTVTQTTPPVTGEVVNVTLDGVTESHTVGIGDTATTIATAIMNAFVTANPPSLTKVTLSVVGGVLNITSNTGVAFAPLTVSVTVTPVGGNPVVGVYTASAATIGPKIATITDMVSNLVVSFATHATCTVTGSGAVLTAHPKASTVYTSIPVSATFSSTSTFLKATWSVNAMVPPLGYLKSTNFHLFVGAETSTVAGVTTDATLAAALSQNVNDRGLSATAAISTSNPSEIQLTSRMSGANGNSMLFALIQMVAGVEAIIDVNLTVNEKPTVLGAVYVPASNAAYYAFGGGVAGPATGQVIFRKRRFVATTPAGTLSWDSANSQVKLTFSAGTATINKAVNISVVGDVVVCPSSSSVQIVVDDQGNVASVVSPALNQVVLGTYSVVGTQASGNLGTFTPVSAVNGNHLLVQAASEGDWAKDVLVSSLFNSDGSITLIATYKDPTDENYVTETFTFTLATQGALDGSLPYPKVVATTNGTLIQAYYMSTTNGLGDEVLSDTQPLTGGANGPVVTVQDYISALNVLSNSQVNILVASGRTEPAIKSLLLSQSAASDEISGMRIGVIAAPPKTSASQAKSMTAGVDSKYAVMVAGWATYANRADLPALSTPPDGFYAGHMAVTPVQASTAARTTSPAFRGITAVDTTVGSTAYNLYTQARMEAIIADPATGVFHCLNGLSLSVDPAWKWISLRRTYNTIRQNIFTALQFAKSEPNTTQLRQRVADTIDNLLFSMQQKGQIDTYQPTQATADNNPPNLVAQGLLRVDVFFTPIYPADNIGVGLHRVVPVSVTVKTGQ